MTEDTDTDDYEERNVLKCFPEKMAHTFIKKSERALCQFMPRSHGNSLYTRKDFAKQLVYIACHGDFISNGSRVYNLEHSGASGDTILHHLHNLSMEDVQCLYEGVNKYLLQLIKKHNIYRRVNVQLAVDFTNKKFYGKHRDEWVRKIYKDGEWMRVYGWMMVSMIHKDLKYPLCIEPAPATVAKAEKMAELLKKVLEKTYSFCSIYSGLICLDREFFNVKVINLLQSFCKWHNSQWLMPAKETKSVKKKLNLGVEGIYPHHITNKKRERAHFTLVIAYNDEGELRPFATNIQVENPKELFLIYKRRWQIETNIRSTRHPFLINTTSLHMPIRDYLMRIAVICCFAWMVINTFMINEYGLNYWITIRMFIVLLFNETIDENPEKLKKAFTKAPLSAQTMERELSLIFSNSLHKPQNHYIFIIK